MKLWKWITDNFFIGVRHGMCFAERKQLVKKREKLSALAGNRVLRSPYCVIFSIIDKEIANIDGEIASLKAATSFEHFIELENERALNKIVDQADALISEADAFLLGLDKNAADYLGIPESDPTDVANVMNFLESNK